MADEQKFLEVIKVDINDGDMVEHTHLVSYERMISDLKLLQRLQGLSLRVEEYQLDEHLF